MNINVQKNYEEVSEKLMDDLNKSAKYFYELGKSGNKSTEVTPEMIPHITQLGLALQLTKNLKEEDSVNLTGRRAHQGSYESAEGILKKLSYSLNANETGMNSVKWSEFEQAYRMIEIAMKYMQSKRTKGKVESVLK